MTPQRKSRSPTHRGIRVSNIEHTLLDEVDNFAIEGGLQAIRDVANNLLADMDRFLTDRCIERDRPLDGLG